MRLLPMTIDEHRARVDHLDLRAVHPSLRLGTASDRYAGWLGQIYPEHYRDRLTSSKKSIAGRTFVEEKVPVESIADYFAHFDCLEIDFTFYSPLRGDDGRDLWPMQQLQRYFDWSPESALFVLKAPQTFFARQLRKGRGRDVSYEANPGFLDRDRYVGAFLEPAVEALGPKLLGIAFQQEYQRVSDAPTSERNVVELDTFFSTLPTDVQSHIELRSPHLLTPDYFAWLRERGIGHVFSHWTYLPSLREQFRMCGPNAFTATDRNVLVRLLTPLGMQYASAYALAHPFDRPVSELSGLDQTREMIDDTAALIYRAADDDVIANIFTNNRAYGNAPSLAQAVAYRVLAEQLRRNQRANV
jgi:uncharacterized protein YecE (DUF72 family)